MLNHAFDGTLISKVYNFVIIQGKTNVILIGDSLGDPSMAENLKDSLDSVIKIGFLNHNVSLNFKFES